MRAGQVDPEVADRVAAAPRDAADERDRDGDADRRRDEVLDGESAHLREVAHRRLAGVVLPVRVRDEADGGVEGERRRDALHAGRVEEERALDALEQVEAEDRDGAEGENRVRVDGPALLPLGVDADHAVHETLDRCEHAVLGQRLAPEDAGDEGAEDARTDEERCRKHGELEPARGAHRLEPLREEQRPDEVGQRRDREHEADHVTGGQVRSVSSGLRSGESISKAHALTRSVASAKNAMTMKGKRTSAMTRLYGP